MITAWSWLVPYLIHSHQVYIYIHGSPLPQSGSAYVRLDPHRYLPTKVRPKPTAGRSACGGFHFVYFTSAKQLGHIQNTSMNQTCQTLEVKQSWRCSMTPFPWAP